MSVPTTVRSIAFGVLLGVLSTARPAAADPDVAPRERVFDAHPALIRSLRWSADGGRIATASFDGTVVVRDVRTGEVRGKQAGFEGGAFWVGLTPDGRIGAAGGAAAVVRLAGAAEAHDLRVPGSAWSGALSPDGTRLAVGGRDGTLLLWNVEKEEEIARIRVPAGIGWTEMSADGAVAVVAAGGSAFLYSTATGALVRVVASHREGVYGVAFSPDGALVATAGADNVAAVHRVTDGATLLRLPHFAAVLGLAFSPDGRRLATGGADYAVRLWDVDSGELLARYTGARQPVWALAFSPDGSTLACGGDAGTIVLWEPEGEPRLPDAAPPGVDLRPELARLGLGVVAQHSRGTCSLHTMTRAIEFALSRREGRGIPLSDEYLNWACNQVIGNTGPKAVDRGQFFEHSWMGLVRHGICRREFLPWTKTFQPATAPSPEALADAQELRRAAFTWRELNGPGVPDDEIVRRVKAVLAAGWPVLAGSSHSVLVVGYVDDLRDPGGGRFIVADSGTGGFIDEVRGDRLHTAIVYARVRDYGFSWVAAHDPPPRIVPADRR